MARHHRSSTAASVVVVVLLLLPLDLCLAISLTGTDVPRQSHRRSRKERGECRIEELDALEPTFRFESEAGHSEFWDRNEQQLQCAGVAASLHTVQPRGLLLPSYSNSPRLAFVIQGSGRGGVVIPGCPETFHTYQVGGSQSRRRQGDEHQRVERIRQGDVVALPAGVAFWFYNDGDEPFVVVSISDTGNYANQLDNDDRRFFLAGSKPREGRRRQRGAEEYQTGHNIFTGFDTSIISEVFGVSEETARKLQGEGAGVRRRGHIVRVEGELHTASPRRQPHRREEESEESEEEERRSTRRTERAGGERRRENGIEETLCNFEFRWNIEGSVDDVYSREGGRWSTLTSSKLPILRYLELNAERGRLNRKNAILAPHWNINAHSIVYATRGTARTQIVDSAGRAVFDGELREGQLVVVPQNFVVVKQATSEEGFEWVSFKTSDYAMTSPLVGKTSVIRGMPEDVLVNSYRISPEEARRLKNQRREETLVLAPRASDQ